jgi:hypothetical protein
MIGFRGGAYVRAHAPTASTAGPAIPAAERACRSASVKARVVSALSRCNIIVGPPR